MKKNKTPKHLKNPKQKNKDLTIDLSKTTFTAFNDVYAKWTEIGERLAKYNAGRKNKYDGETSEFFTSIETFVPLHSYIIDNYRKHCEDFADEKIAIAVKEDIESKKKKYSLALAEVERKLTSHTKQFSIKTKYDRQ